MLKSEQTSVKTEPTVKKEYFSDDSTEFNDTTDDDSSSLASTSSSDISTDTDSDTFDDSSSDDLSSDTEDEAGPSTKEGEKKRNKKHDRFFDLYIHRCLRVVSQNNNSVSKNARVQLNSILCYICDKIASKASDLCRYGQRRTVHITEVATAVEYVLRGKLLSHANIAAVEALKTFFADRMYEGTVVKKPVDFDIITMKKRTDIQGPMKKTMSRQNKAGLIFSPALCEKFLRSQRLHVSQGAPIYMAAVIEYFTTELLILVCNEALADKRVRLLAQDFEMSIRKDFEFNLVFNENKMSFVANCVTPFLSPMVLEHMSRPFARNIVNLQNTADCVIMSRFAIDRQIRAAVEAMLPGTRVGKDTVSYIQYIVEQEMIHNLRHAAQVASYAGHSKLTASDLEITLAIKQNRQPVFDE